MIFPTGKNTELALENEKSDFQYLEQLLLITVFHQSFYGMRSISGQSNHLFFNSTLPEPLRERKGVRFGRKMKKKFIFFCT